VRQFLRLKLQAIAVRRVPMPIQMPATAHPVTAEIDSLLDSFVWNCHTNAQGLRKICRPSELSSALQQVLRRATQQNRAWSAWTDEHQDWLYTAEMSASLSRERGAPVLEIATFDEAGHLGESAIWQRVRDGRWQRCFVQ
jgi:hypothetical protein